MTNWPERKLNRASCPQPVTRRDSQGSALLEQLFSALAPLNCEAVMSSANVIPAQTEEASGGLSRRTQQPPCAEVSGPVRLQLP